MNVLRRAVQENARRSFLRGGAEEFSPKQNGFLFNEKPGPRVKETWEYIWVYGMGGAFVFAGVGHYYSPDTSPDTFSDEEIKRRALELQTSKA